MPTYPSNRQERLVRKEDARRPVRRPGPEAEMPRRREAAEDRTRSANTDPASTRPVRLPWARSATPHRATR